MYRRNFDFSKLLTLALLALVTLSLGACKDDENVEGVFDEEAGYRVGKPVTDSTVAAIAISGDQIDTLTVEELETRFRNFAQVFPQIMYDPEQARQLRKDIVEDFVNVHVLRGEADRLGIRADSLQVEAQISQFRADTASYAFLMAQGVTEDEVRERLGEQSRLQALGEQIAQNAGSPSAEDVEQFRQEQAQRVNAQHILIRTEQGAAGPADAQARNKAQAILDSIKAGADFAELARRHSEDPGSAQQGGVLGFFGRGELVPEFENVAFGLPEGQLAPEIVKTPYGYHIIKVLERETGETLDPQTAAAALTERRRQESVMKEVERLKKDVTVRLNHKVLGIEEQPAGR